MAGDIQQQVSARPTTQEDCDNAELRVFRIGEGLFPPEPTLSTMDMDARQGPIRLRITNMGRYRITGLRSATHGQATIVDFFVHVAIPLNESKGYESAGPH
jgi:hypothetical protein